MMNDNRVPEADSHIRPASPAQQRLWFLDQLNPADVSYNMAQAYRLRGVLDHDVLSRSLDAIVRRHESLRTTFVLHNDLPAQVVHKRQPSVLSVVDATANGVDTTEAGIQDLIDNLLAQPFNLQNGPLFRAFLYQLAADDHVLVTAEHHIIFDRMSEQLLFDELRTFYEHFSEGSGGSPSGLPELPIQYADYAAWKTAKRREDARAREMEYWRKRLDGLQALNLPTDAARTKFVTNRGARMYRDIPAASIKGFAKLANQIGATPFMGLLAIFQVVLHKWTGDTDIPVGTPFADRRLQGTRELLGFFVNNLVLRGDLSGDLTFLDFLQQIRSTCFAAYRHGDVPFGKLVEKLAPQRQVNRNPLFDVQFAFQKNHLPDVWLGGVRGTPLVPSRSTAQFDLNLTVREGGRGYDARIEYRTDLFQADTIELLLQRYIELLQRISAQPGGRISGFPLGTNREYERIAGDFNDTGVAYSPCTSILHFIRKQAQSTPDAVAIKCDNDTATFGELDARSEQLAVYLRRLGATANVLVGVCIERSIDMMVCLVGIMKSGAAYVPLDPDYPSDRLKFMINDANTPILLTQQHLLRRIPATAAKIVCIDNDWDEIACDSAREALEIDIDPEDLAYVIYTSGSTGLPKGAMNSHAAVCNRLLWMDETFALQPTDAVLQKTPISFDVSVWELFWPLMKGARLVIPKPGGHQDPAYLAEIIRTEQITVLHFVPSMLRVFLDQEDLGAKCESVRDVICSGEALSYELQMHFFQTLNADLHNLYGPTEAAVDVTYWHCRRDDDDRTVPIGRPIANTQIHILDEQLQPVPIGVEGELHIGGVQVGKGYLNRPGLTAERFIPDTLSNVPGGRLYKSGDLARWRNDGAIEYRGRIDFQVKIRGLRIELGEIEAAISDNPEVNQVVVVVREDEPGDSRMAAYYVMEQDQQLDSGALRKILGKRLPGFMIPQYFVELPSMPLNSNGKIDRNALPAPDMAAVKRDDGYVAPRTAIEKGIAAAWKSVLDHDAIGIQDNFIELGGHSLLALKVISILKRQLQIDVSPMSMIMDTLEQIAAEFTDGAGQDNDRARTAPGTQLSPLYLGDAEAPLLGMHHRPASGTDNGRGVLICNPVFMEATKAYWSLKRLSDSLAEAGYHVLRFDYYATGDSSGESAKGRVADWIQNIRQATRRLQDLSGADRVSIVGLRFGASLAAMTDVIDVEQLVLWDPIVSGKTYLDALQNRQRNIQGHENEYRSDELLGYACPSGLRESIAAVDLLAEFPSSAEDITLITSQDLAQYNALESALVGSGYRCRKILAEDVCCEIDERASLSAFLPGPSLVAVRAVLTEPVS